MREKDKKEKFQISLEINPFSIDMILVVFALISCLGVEGMAWKLVGFLEQI